MKAGTTDKIKFKRLRQSLKLPDWQLVGLLESMWQATYSNAPAGDIGRLSNVDIAISIGWEDDADALIGALVETGWLDADPQHRLLVHDWEEHCASWLRANFARHGKEFAKPTTQPTEQVTTQATEQRAEQPTQQPTTKLPPYQAKPNHTKPITPCSPPRGTGSRRKKSKPSAESEIELPPLPATLESPRMRQVLGDWLANKSKPPKPIALKALVTRLEKRAVAHGVDAVCDALELAMGNDWAGWDFDSSFEGRTAQPESRVVTSEEFAEMQRNGFNLTTGEATR